MVLATAVLLLQFSAFPGASTTSQPSPKPLATAEVAKVASATKKGIPVAVAPANPGRGLSFQYLPAAASGFSSNNRANRAHESAVVYAKRCRAQRCRI